MRLWLKLRLHKWRIVESPSLALLEAWYPDDWYRMAKGWNARAAETRRRVHG